MRFFVGGYSPELYMAWLHEESGAIELVSSVTTPANASFLALHPNGRTLYATVETGYKTGESGKVTAYRVDAAHRLTAIGSASTCGAGPCHIAIDKERGMLVLPNYGGRSLAVLGLSENGMPGKLLACVEHTGSSVHVLRQREPHPHGAIFSPDGVYLLVCDLGTDRIEFYRVDGFADGITEPVASVAVTPGAGPRHLIFSHDGAFAYVINELSNSVGVYAYSADGPGLTLVQEAPTLPESVKMENTCAEIQIHPSGRYVYASNRGHDSITVFTRDKKNGQLERRGFIGPTGATPRHFSIDPSGLWCVVANQYSDTVVSYRLNPETGLGHWTGHEVIVTAPACAIFCA
jgi:6-phosphogluconolactonase